MVMMIARTPSLNASSRLLLDADSQPETAHLRAPL